MPSDPPIALTRPETAAQGGLTPSRFVALVLVCALIIGATVAASLTVPLADTEPGLIGWLAQ